MAMMGHPMAADTIKIVALNIGSGGGTRVTRLCDYLDAQQADVIVLTEWRDTIGGQALCMGQSKGPSLSWARRWREGEWCLRRLKVSIHIS